MKTALFFACNKRFLFALGTALLSLKQNSPKMAAESAIIIYSQGFTEEDKNLLNAVLPCTIVDYTFPIETDFSHRNFRNFSQLAFARYEIFKLLDNFDKVLYMDTDILIGGELGFIFEYFGDGDGIALCKDNQKGLNLIDKNFIKPLERYDMTVPCYNSGVILFSKNLKNRERLKSWCYEKSVSWMDNLTCPDQGVLNVMFQEFAIEAEELPDICNCLPSNPKYHNKLDNMVLIYHCAGGGLRFWTYTYHREWRKFYDDYLAMGGKPHTDKEHLWLKFIKRFGFGRFDFFNRSPDPQMHPGRFLKYAVQYVTKKAFLKIFANRAAIKDYDFSRIKSVLINPIGDALGDVIIHSAVCAQLKAAYPGIAIGYLKKPRNASLIEKNSCVDAAFKQSIKNAFLWRKKWQLYLDFSSTWTSNNILFSFILAPQYNICFEKKPKPFYAKGTVKNYDYYAEYGDIHMGRILEATPLAKLVDSSNVSYSLPDVSNLAPSVEKWWEEGKVRVLFNACGSIFKRRIDKNDSLKILNEICLNFPYAEVLISNTKENKKLLTEEDYIKFAPPASVLEMIALVKSADIVITVDTVLVHIAHAFGKRLVAVYGNCPNNYKRFGPLDNGLSDMVVSKKIAPNSEIIEGLDTGEVMRAVSKHILSVGRG